jgi:hypothetical protein
MILKNSFVKILAACLMLTGIVIAVSCKKSFEEPPYPTDPEMKATHTIKQLKAMHTSSGAYDQVTTDVIISGVVTANDRSGNLYKEIYIQDETGAIAVELDAYNLFTSFPVGRRVFIKCKGLTISDYRYLIQLGVKTTLNGTASLSGIPSPTIGDYLVGGSINNPVVPKVVNGNLLKTGATGMQDSLTGALIQLNDYQVANSDTSYTWADTSSNKNSVNINIENCAGDKNLIRTSGYSNFAAAKVPRGKGNVVAIYTIFNTTKQLIIRDTSDVKMTTFPRCDGSTPGGPTVPPTTMTIAALRAMYTGSDVTLPANVSISATVISDAANKNITAGNMVVQDGTAGIDLYYGSAAATTNFNVGDSVQFVISGGTLTKYNGMLEVSLGSSQLPSTKIAIGKTVTPKVVTVAQFNSSLANIECQLVRIENATSDAGTYSGNRTITDATGSTTLRTNAAATFAGNTVPSGSQNWVGYGNFFNTTPQLNLRSTSDVTAGTGGGGNPPVGGTGINLGTSSPFVLNFDNIASGLPTGVFVKQTSTATSLGTDATIFGGSLGTTTPWSNVSFGVKNFASATGLSASSDQTAQDASTNRALGIRQTSTAGSDPGVAFAFQLANTTGKTNLGMSFKLQSLDNSVGRTTIWKVQYGMGSAPTAFTDVATSPASLTTSPTWGSTTVNVSLPAAVANQSGNVWIRIVTLDATTGSGSRPSTAVDDVNFTWN